ncbi:cation:proton antiporter [Methanolacinia paynteri]|uniref:cation:proton antiporter n=1 Tax=Methanolacinia paynteri TaxID=230356 RepID=UPI00064F5A9E|nr:cation:proton antiporter [Methanolacinia paynteri]
MFEGIALALLVCLILAWVSKKVRFPPIPAYMFAGLLLGAGGLGIVGESDVSDFLAEAGLLFLLFTMGLELKPGEIYGQGRSFLLSGTVDLAINILTGYAVAIVVGFDVMDAVVIACAFYISSSAMAVASLIENRKLAAPESETILWIMVFEDIMLLLIIVALSSGSKSPAAVIATAAVLIAGFFALCYLFRKTVRAFLERYEDLGLLFTFSIVLAAGGVAIALDIPSTLVAIALGSAMSVTKPEILEKHARPFRDIFLVIFFVFFGISVDLSSGFPVVSVILLSLAAVTTKLISSLVIGKATHGNYLSGIEIWSETTARGEFSLAIATYGSPLVLGTIAVMVLITSTIGGLTGKYSDKIKRYVRKKSVKGRLPG